MEYAKLFPGASTGGDGPCQSPMLENFKKDSCSETQCTPYFERMISACLNLKIPDIPPDNSLAGVIMTTQHAANEIIAMNQAGCASRSVEELKNRKPPVSVVRAEPFLEDKEDVSIELKHSVNKKTHFELTSKLIFKGPGMTPSFFRQEQDLVLDGFRSAIEIWDNPCVLRVTDVKNLNAKIAGAVVVTIKSYATTKEASNRIRLRVKDPSFAGMLARQVRVGMCPANLHLTSHACRPWKIRLIRPWPSIPAMSWWRALAIQKCL
jgi:hypothetical protein